MGAQALKRLAEGVVAVLLLFAAWWAVTALGGEDWAGTGPLRIWSLFRSNWPGYLGQLYRTFLAAGLGILLAGLVGLVASLVVALVPWFAGVAYTMAIMVKATPAVAFAPLLLLIVRGGGAVKVIVSAMICFFPMMVGALDGLKRVPVELAESVRVFKVGPCKYIRRVGWGWMFSGYLTGLKTGAPLAVVGAIVAEFVTPVEASDTGVGTYIMVSHHSGIHEGVVLGVIEATALGVILFAVAAGFSWLMERRLKLYGPDL